jgi:hypothetical protein
MTGGLREALYPVGLNSLIGLQGLQAYYDALTASSVTYTAATAATSQWSDLSGLGHHLLQATGANQPIYIRQWGLLNQLTCAIVFSGAGSLSGASATGFTLSYSGAGNVPYVAAQPAMPLIPGSIVRVSFTLTLNSGVGVDALLTNSIASFFTTLASNLTPGTPTSYSYDHLVVTAENAPLGLFCFKPTTNAAATNFTVSNLSYTYIDQQATGLYCDGSAFYLQTAVFTLVRPSWVVLIGKQFTYSNGPFWSDGRSGDMRVIQWGGSNKVTNDDGGTNGVSLALGTTGIIAATYIASGSQIQINNTSPSATTTSTDGGGFTVGASRAGASFGNILINGAAVFNVAPNPSDILKVVNYFAKRYAISV